MSGRSWPGARIASPSSSSLPVWLLASVPSLATAVHDRNLFGGSLGAWLGAATAGALAAGGVLWLGGLVLRTRRTLPAVVTMFALAGCVRGFALGQVACGLDLAGDPQPVVRAVSGAILAVCWLSVATLIVDGFRTHRGTRLELEERKRRADAAHRRAEAELEALTSVADRLVGEVTRLADAVALFRADEGGGRHTLVGVAEALHEVSMQGVRRLSHEAVSRQDAPPAPLVRPRPLGVIVADALSVEPFRPVLTALLLLLSIMMTAIRGYGPVLGVVGAVWIATMAAAVLWCGRRLAADRLRHWRLPVQAGVVATVWMAAGAAASLPVAWSHQRMLGPARAWEVFGEPLLAYVPLICGGVAIAAAISRAWALDDDERKARLAALQWETSLVRQGIWAERMRLARFLHGSVQSLLTSTALFIELAVARGEALDAVAAEARRRLEGLAAWERQREASRVIDVAAVCERIAAVWSRQARVEIDMEPAAVAVCRQEFDAAEQVVEIIREGISNAIRHGRAREVRVSVARLSATLSIEVRDDGTPLEPAHPGLGSAMLDEMCLAWSRSRLPGGGTLLRCEIPTTGGLGDDAALGRCGRGGTAGDRVMTHSQPLLQAAYEATSYLVDESPVGPFAIRCGSVSGPLERLLSAAGEEVWGFVHAGNPGSRPLAGHENLRRQESLVARVEGLGLRGYPGRGVGDDGRWPAEAGLLVPGLTEAGAVALGREFGQLAVVVGTRGRPARLAWVEAEAAPVTNLPPDADPDSVAVTSS